MRIGFAMWCCVVQGGALARRSAIATLVLLMRHARRGATRVVAAECVFASSSRVGGWWRRALFLDAVACCSWLYSRAYLKESVVPVVIDELLKVCGCGWVCCTATPAPLSSLPSPGSCLSCSCSQPMCAFEVVLPYPPPPPPHPLACMRLILRGRRTGFPVFDRKRWYA